MSLYQHKIELSETILLFPGMFLFCVLATLVFLPSITFSIYSPEVFPWALLFVLFYLRRVDVLLLLVILLMVLSAVTTVLKSDGGYLFESIRSLASYLNSLVIFSTILTISVVLLKRIIRIARMVFIVLIIVGFLQYSDVFNILDPVLKFFVPRASATSLSYMGGRGVTLLSSEPARAGIDFLFIYLVVRTVYLSPKQKMLADLFVGLFILILIKSAACIAFYIVFLVFFYGFRLLYFAPLILIVLLFVFQLVDVENSRALLLMKNISTMPSMGEVLFTVSNNSGHRIISIVASYYYGLIFPLGGGIGNWMESSVEALNLTGINLSEYNYFLLHGEGDAVPIRASGYVTNLMIDVGIIGIIIFFYYIFSRLHLFWSGTPNARPIILVFLVKILFFGSVGNPVAWVATAVCLRYLYSISTLRKRNDCRPIYGNNCKEIT